ncbi:maleylpyruvate isomerase family mycothiol-dependent enzyme [Actinoplanes philippinensis]|uniref:maleylpyruvate isomerase family mycothiol-dependent enzyme n=1 Tax=Actinoplanes philippinensis TaxID=35752 RepID=UPI0033D4AA56
MNVDHEPALAAFRTALDDFAGVAEGLTDLELMAASPCTGWTAGDVIVHVHLGLQEMLLGLVTLTDEKPGTDAATYWRSTPRADEEDQLAAMRFIRLLASSYRRPSAAVRHLLPTATGVRAAADRLEPGAVRFQGHVLPTGDFLATWAVELAVHQLDLARDLPVPPPPPAALRLARETVEALAGAAAPADWPDDVVVLLGAGRVEADARQRAEAPALAGRLPVLG